MSWLGALYNRQHHTVIPEGKETHQGGSTTTPVLCLGKNIPVVLWAGFQAEYSGTAQLRTQKSEFSRHEEAGICKTGHQRKRKLYKGRSSKVHLEVFQEFGWGLGCMFIGRDYLRLTRGYKVERGTEILPVDPRWRCRQQEWKDVDNTSWTAWAFSWDTRSLRSKAHALK